MSGSGAPAVPASVDGTRPALRLAHRREQWHPEITDALLAGALPRAAEAGVDRPDRGPRARRLRAAGRARRRWPRTHDAVVALGVVIRGGTPHFEYVCDAATDGLTRVALDTATRSASACSPATPRSRPATAPACRLARGQGRPGGRAALATAVTLRALRASVCDSDRTVRSGMLSCVPTGRRYSLTSQRFLIAGALIDGRLVAQNEFQRGDLPDLRPSGGWPSLGLVIAGGSAVVRAAAAAGGPAGDIRCEICWVTALVPWSEVVGVSFPAGSPLGASRFSPTTSTYPVMAIQAVDKDRAVDAMDTVRSLLARYRPLSRS